MEHHNAAGPAGRQQLRRHEVDITPDKSLISKLGMTGYRTEQAVAELVDNSIDARAGSVRVQVRLDFAEKKITVSDDGRGMGYDDLIDALTIAKHSGEGLGKFGIGMKSSCSSLGAAFAVTTTAAGSEREFVARYDEDEWLKDGSSGWRNFAITEGMTSESRHGTTVEIAKTRVPLYPNQVSIFAKRFGVRYGPHLADGRTHIHINSRKCIPATPAIQEGTRREVSISLGGNDRITGWVGMLQKRSVKGDYGIHLYWRGRLIRAFDKFGVRRHPAVSGIIGSVSLDHVPVNFHKTGFIEESPEYVRAVEIFKNDESVLAVLRACLRGAPEDHDVSSAFGPNPGPFGARMSAEPARKLMAGADGFSASRNGFDMKVGFEDGPDGIYSMRASPDKASITIRRDSRAFEAFRNPLFLLGWIGIEAELLASGPPDAESFLAERNKRWTRFMHASLRNKAHGDGVHTVPDRIPDYALADELVGLHDRLVAGFDRKFQFTGISTLSSFLSKGYRQAVYTVRTARGAGQALLEEIEDEFDAVLNPKPHQIRTVLDLAKTRRLVAVREGAGRIASTWALPDRAWFDLCLEVVRNGVTMYRDELDGVLEDLVDRGLADPDRIRSLAKRAGFSKIESYMGGA